MKNKDIKQKLKTAAEHAAPNDFDSILAACQPQQAQLTLLPAVPAKPPRRSMPLRALAMAASLVLLVGGAFALLRFFSRAESVVILDVNPSIRIEVSRSEKVLAAHPNNRDGETVLDGMDLSGTSLDVAVNALIGSMVRRGYLNEFANSVLLTVEGGNTARSTDMEQRLSAEISGLLQSSAMGGAVLSQHTASDPALEKTAQHYGISQGKAALIQKIADENPQYTLQTLAQLSVNDLHLLLNSKRVNASATASSGAASDKAYIGKEHAKAAALARAGLEEAGVEWLEVEMDCDDGEMVYEVEFKFGGVEYEYKINARNGSAAGETPSGEAGISTARAREIVLAHAGLPAGSTVPMEIELEHNAYEISFEHKNMEYEYLVHAGTGEILRWEAEREDD